MYLEYFKFHELPFTLTPNIDFFCYLKGHQEALNVLLFSLNNGEGFIKIVGEVGAGKTLLCRKLLSSLSHDFITAYIPNPDLNPLELRKAFLRELHVDPTALAGQDEVINLINTRLLELYSEGKRVILILDEAQALSDESLETIRLLTNLETEKKKLLQVVLFGQPELDSKLNLAHLRQLKQRITFSYYLPTLSREDLDTYLFHRLTKAGFSYGHLFTQKAKDQIYRYSKGIPRIINILCHKALLVAYGRGEQHVSKKAVSLAIKDTELPQPKRRPWLKMSIGFILGLIVTLLAKEFI